MQSVSLVPAAILVSALAFCVAYTSKKHSDLSIDREFATLKNLLKTASISSKEETDIGAKTLIKRLLRYTLLRLDCRRRYKNLLLKNCSGHQDLPRGFSEVLDKNLNIFLEKYANYSNFTSKNLPRIAVAFLALGLNFERYICKGFPHSYAQMLSDLKVMESRGIESFEHVLESVQRHAKYRSLRELHYETLTFSNRLQCINSKGIHEELEKRLHTGHQFMPHNSLHHNDNMHLKSQVKHQVLPSLEYSEHRTEAHRSTTFEGTTETSVQYRTVQTHLNLDQNNTYNNQKQGNASIEKELRHLSPKHYINETLISNQDKHFPKQIPTNNLHHTDQHRTKKTSNPKHSHHQSNHHSATSLGNSGDLSYRLEEDDSFQIRLSHKPNHGIHLQSYAHDVHLIHASVSGHDLHGSSQHHTYIDPFVAIKTEILASILVTALVEGYRIPSYDTPCPAIFVQDIFHRYGDSQGLSFAQFKAFYNDILERSPDCSKRRVHMTAMESQQHDPEHHEHPIVSGREFHAESKTDNTRTSVHSIIPTHEKEYYNFTEIMKIFDVGSRTQFNAETFMEICPAILHGILSGAGEKSDENKSQNTPKYPNPSTPEKYGFGTLCVLLISLCSLSGIVLVKCAISSTKTLFLTSLMALSVGCLIGDAMLHLLPHVFHVHTHDGDDKSVTYKLCGALGSVYAFFLLELCFSRYHKHGLSDENHSLDSVSKSTTNDTNTNIKLNNLHEPKQENASRNGAWRQVSTNSAEKDTDGDSTREMTTTVDKTSPKSLAWMILVGELIHNFADGLAIGAGFSENLTEGLSTSLAVFCHELPHELGDFAALLSTGMSVKKALLFNFLSSLSAFVGLYIGIVMGTNDETRKWIFSFGAGMFIYVALVTLVPQLVYNFRRHTSLKMFVLLNVGLLSGFVSMFLLAIFEDDIRFTI